MMKKLLYLLLIIFFISSCSTDKNGADAYGNFESIEYYVSAKANGELIDFLIKKGVEYKENSIVGQIDTTILYLQKQQLFAKQVSILSKLDEVDSQTSIVLAKLKNLKLNMNRISNLVKSEAAPQKDLDNIKTEIEITENQIKQAKVKKKSIWNEQKVLLTQIDLLNKQISDCKIVNPVAGVILEKFIENHEICVMGKPLYKIANLSTLELKAYVSARQLSEIEINKSVKVAIDGAEDLIFFDGTISWIASEAEFTPKIIQSPEDRLNLVYAIKVRVENNGQIKIGMPGEVYFERQKSVD